jgi:soluble lytic murein transglycosylase-like protein
MANVPKYIEYKDGFPLNVDDWLLLYIQTQAIEYDFDPTYIIGLIVTESTFRADAKSDDCVGLA